MSEARLLRIAEVGERVGLGKTKIYALIKDGEFPEPTKVGKASRWLSRDVTEWIEARQK